MLLINFVELRVVAGRSWTRAGRPHAVSGRPMLIRTCHAMRITRCAVALRSRFQNGMVVAWHGRGMACVNQTRSHCVNQMGKTRCKPLAARHGRRTAWSVWISLKGAQNTIQYDTCKHYTQIHMHNVAPTWINCSPSPPHLCWFWFLKLLLDAGIQ
jgi:hypothetical protein